MSELVVLGDAAVGSLLLNLTKSEIESFADKLGESLRQYSTTAERQYQPSPASIVRPDGQKVLFRPFTSPGSVGTKIIVDPAPVRSGDGGGGEVRKLPLHGVLVVCDSLGLPAGLINAEEVTGFRTSLSAMIPFRWRRRVEHVVLFGAGKQALWHLRLALALRGRDVRSLTLVNRSRERAELLAAQIGDENASRWKSAAAIATLHPADPDYADGLRSALARADVVFCTVPSTRPLFEAADMPPREEKQPLISAIGSWQPDMVEIHPDLVRRIADDRQAFRHDDGSHGGSIIVDDRQSAVHDAGEVVQSGIKQEQLLELGEAIDRRAKSEDSDQRSQAFSEWLAEGFVLYKSVGVGITDLVAGEAILELAKERSIGTRISDF